MLANQTLSAPVLSTRRVGPIMLWVVQLLLAALFIFGGINKLVGIQQEMIDNFARLGFGLNFRYLVGVLELIGGLALLIPRLSGLGALLLTGVMVGAIITHLTVQPPMALALVPATLGGLLLLIARRRPYTQTMLDRFTR